MQPPLGPHLSDRGGGSGWSSNGTRPSAEQPSKTFHRQSRRNPRGDGERGRPLGVTELGAFLGLPKPTTHRIMRHLDSEGLLQREPGAGATCQGALGAIWARHRRRCHGARPTPRNSRSAVKEIGETCNFGVMSEATRSISIAWKRPGPSACDSSPARACRCTARRWASCCLASCRRSNAALLRTTHCTVTPRTQSPTRRAGK